MKRLNLDEFGPPYVPVVSNMAGWKPLDMVPTFPNNVGPNRGFSIAMFDYRSATGMLDLGKRW